MFNRMKTALYNAVSGIDALPPSRESDNSSVGDIPSKFRYTRPNFLQLNTDDEIQVSADHVIRPIIVPRDITKLPWNSGYAEAINAGKSIRNEDQASMYRGTLHKTIDISEEEETELGVETKEPVASHADTSKAIPETAATPSEVVTNGNEESADLDSASNSVNNPTAPLKNTSSQDSSSAFATPPSTPSFQRKNSNSEQVLPWIYFGLFDGHAGSGAAVVAANTLYKIIEEKLEAIKDYLLPFSEKTDANTVPTNTYSPPERVVTKDSLIIGALETAFWEMDKQIGQDKIQYRVTGGCTAVVAVFLMGKVYVANAGDSRAILCRGSKAVPLSNDFTPESERDRIRYLGLLRPELLGHEFTHLEYIRRPVRKDLGKKMLYRDGYMSGWAYKTVTTQDLRFPLIYGEGKRSRVLATIGVTRGFGDHDLKAQTTDVDIKPFLTAQPEVIIYDLMDKDLTDSDVVVMGTDGLWDITANETAAKIVQKSLDHFPANDTQRYKYRYISAAQDLVMHSRGKLRERNWKTADNKAATIDDITVFVIPLKPYKEEYIQTRLTLMNGSTNSETLNRVETSATVSVTKAKDNVIPKSTTTASASSALVQS